MILDQFRSDWFNLERRHLPKLDKRYVSRITYSFERKLCPIVRAQSRLIVTSSVEDVSMNLRDASVFHVPVSDVSLVTAVNSAALVKRMIPTKINVYSVGQKVTMKIEKLYQTNSLSKVLKLAIKL